MIYTVTLNPSIDYVMAVPDYISGATNRAQTTNA
ncbi:1-phosphofructokinase, partial [Weissella cibaria]|nr:1-phosphofructokinase [Weissella cibaria]